MITDKRIGMIVAANYALAYKRQNPLASTEEIFKHVLSLLKVDKETKIPSIAGANFVLKYLEANPKATEKEIMQKLANETPRILSEIEAQERESEF